ncbi:phospholipase A [Stakelama pacifica]|uniref:Phospholipase A1 n=1 Tax=Stakelama pacifica TaxID=517720 RepID=A0A4R6FW33_9SPHN|nr:phospholipase A [Stakelama pacifica]TDN85510.1 phospholipase A1-like protein [Stakelama pacifica]GGO92435.1 hypothetical protein GCM10011329_09500 [Stakelama pacifica]
MNRHSYSRSGTLFAALSLFGATAAHGQQSHVVPEQPADAREARDGVDVFVFNESDTASPLALPDRIAVTAHDGTTLILSAPDEAAKTVAAGRFVRVRYHLVSPDQPASPTLASSDTPAPPPTVERGVMTSTGSHSGLTSRLEPHDPVYGVMGAGDAGTKLQFSLALRPFEGAGILDGLRFAYTQTMFWATDQESAPFTSTIYSPEIYYEIRPDASLAIAAGYHHDSNGGDPDNSVDMNKIFLRGAKRFDLSDRWYAEVAPEAWFFFSTEYPRQPIRRYAGYTALRLTVGETDGIKVSGRLTGNPGTGKAAGEAFISYPLTRIDGSVGVYIFGQAYSGYGESLNDYDRNDSHARIGIAFTR